MHACEWSELVASIFFCRRHVNGLSGDDGPEGAVFKALSDSTRRAMVERLAQESMPVAQLAEPFKISAPAISKHLRVLERAGLLEREIRGTTHICHLRGEGLTAARAWLDAQRRF